MRDEMKSQVLRIAAEKFRLGQKDAITAGKFEFCNTLYVKLMEEIHACLGDMFLKVNIVLNFSVPSFSQRFQSIRDYF